MPPVIYECAVRGTCQGEDVINVLYYAVLEPSGNGWDATRAGGLGDAVATAWENNALPYLPTTYEAQSVTVRGLDLNRDTVSTYAVERPMSGNGTNTGTLNGAGPVGIIAFQTSAAPEYESERVPRRSYLAFGPLTDATVSDNGSIPWPAPWITNLTALLTQGHLIGAAPFTAVRLGTPNAANVPAIGQVDGVIFRPNASFRRSRMKSPKGG